MSAIQRYESLTINSRGERLIVGHPSGSFCLYADLLWYKKLAIGWCVAAIVVSVAFGFVAALLVHEKAARGPVVVPMGAGEKAELLKGVKEMQADKERAEKQRDDYKALALNYKAQIKTLNAREDSHIAQLEALQARGREIDRLNHEQAQRMSTHQGVVLEAKRVLGVEHVQIVDR